MPASARRLGEFQRAEQIAFVGQTDRRHVVFEREFNKVFADGFISVLGLVLDNLDRAFGQRIGRMNAQMNERG